VRGEQVVDRDRRVAVALQPAQLRHQIVRGDADEHLVRVAVFDVMVGQCDEAGRRRRGREGARRQQRQNERE